MTVNKTAHLLFLRDVASWQLPELTRDTQGLLHKPDVLAGLPSRGWPTEPTVLSHWRWRGTGTATPGWGMNFIKPEVAPR